MYFMINMLIILIFILIIHYFNKMLMKTLEIKTNFECGFETNQNTRKSFSLRFFSLTIIFLLFDLEFSIVFPMILILNTEKIWLYLIMYILMVGMMIEWNQGSLNWK